MRQSAQFDPDACRMTIGEHLDELRYRMILALIGLGVAFVICLIFGRQVVVIFCMPLIHALREANLNPQLIFTGLPDAFLVYVKISLICAVALASPWMVYQIWKFVAAGLYPHERKYVTRYLPLSIGLLLGGMGVVYFLVLPLALGFLIEFGTTMRLPEIFVTERLEQVEADRAMRVPIVAGDPAERQDGDVWYNSYEQRLKIQVEGMVRTLAFAPEGMLTPLPTLPDYIRLVVMLLLAFGLCFQLPLVVLALERMGIVEIEAMRAGRKFVYFGLGVLAAVATPADVFSMIGLMIPLIILYEFGIWLAQRGREQKA